MKLLSYSDIPTRKTPETRKVLTLGTGPIAVLVPWGEISFTIEPSSRPKRRANRVPTKTPRPLLKSSSDPANRLFFKMGRS